MAVTDTPPRLLTAHDLLRLYSEGVRGELIRGTLCETMPTGHEHGTIVANLVILLGSFIKLRKLGRLTASHSGVWLERDPDTVREPNIAYFSAQKIPLDQRVTGYAQVVPDLVVEVASPGDSRREINDKALMWLSYGTRTGYGSCIPTPAPSTPIVRAPATLTLTQSDALHGFDALPGFTCDVRDVFAA